MILLIIHREWDRAWWRRLGYLMKPHQGWRMQRVQVEVDDGGIEKFTDRDGIENAKWANIHKKWFHLAEQAPICSGELQQEFGYNADTPIARQVLDRVYGG